MSLIVVAAPPPCLTLAEAKRHLRVEHDDDDAYITGIVAAAEGWVRSWLGRAFRATTYELRLCEFDWGCRGGIVIDVPPLIAIESVSYTDRAGAARTVPPADYDVYGIGSDTIGAIRPAAGKAWPEPSGRPEAVKVRFKAGYADGPDGEIMVPEPMRHALKLLVGQWYGAREPVSDHAGKELPFAVTALLAPFRVWI